MKALASKEIVPETTTAAPPFASSRGQEAIIRTFDLVASLFLLLLLCPFFVLVALAIKLDSPGPVFFRQERLGRNGKIFSLWKFRTMIPGAAGQGTGALTAADDLRITKVGRVLRLTSVDELPQLINVVKGEMSLVGPRPGLPEHLEKYDQRQKGRLRVRPGITGWAQIKGRNALPWPKRIEHDLWYIAHRSILLNLHIIFATIPVLFRRDFVYGPPENFLFSKRDAR